MSSSWQDVERQLDPNISDDDRNKIRLKYFHDLVLPKIDTSKYSVEATYQDFLQRTDRPKSLTDMARSAGEGFGNILVSGAKIAALTAVTGPISAALSESLLGAGTLADAASAIGRGGLAFATYNALEAKDGDRAAAAVRGGVTGALWEAGLGAVLGFSSKGAAKVLQESMNEKLPGASSIAPDLTPEEIHGPAATRSPEERWFRVFGAARQAEGIKGDIAQEPSFTRVPEGELGLTKPEAPKPQSKDFDVEWSDVTERPALPAGQEPRGLLTESGDQGARKLGTTRGSGGKIRRLWEAPGAVSEGLQDSVEEARKQGYLVGPMEETPSVKGMRVRVKLPDGKAAVVNVPRGTEGQVTGQIEDILSKGGSLDGVEFHPASRSRASEFMKYFAEKAESEDAPIRMRTPKGKAPDVALQLNRMGLQGTVLDDSTVTVGPEAPWVKAQRARKTAKAAEEFVSGGGKAPETSDVIAKNLFRQGEIRTQIQMGNGTRVLHAELHHLQGDLGAMTGIRNRADLGQLGLRYFERTITGDKVDAADMIAKYKGERGPIGERPDVGNKEPSGVLKGYRAPSPTMSERLEFDTSDEDLLSEEGQLRVRPTGTTKRLNASGEDLGFGGAQINTEDGPLRILSADADRETIYHESVHDGLAHADLERDLPELAGDHQRTGMDIAKGLLGEYGDLYKGQAPHQLLNEAFTHAATAVRMGDDETLAQLAEWDTSKEHVEAFVNETASNAWQASLNRDTAPIRAFQRRMNDLVRRTSPMRTEALGRAQFTGYTTWFNPDIAQWVMRDGDGRELLKADLPSVFDHIDQADPSSHFPDIAHKPYFKGLRGPLVPPGSEPIDGSTTLEHEVPPLGFQALSSISRPTLDWAASVQSVLDKHGVDVDFYGAIKDADDKGRVGFPAMDDMHERFASILEDVPAGRRLDYGEVAAHPEAQWGTMSDALGLGPEDLANIRAIKEWDDQNVNEGGVSLMDTLSQLRKVREAGGDVQRALGTSDGLVADAVKSGALGYSDLHIGRIMPWVVRKSIDQRYLDEPLKAIEELAKTRSESGNLLFDQLQWPLRNYVNNMRGIPDASQKIMNSWIESMTDVAEGRAKQLNAHLPASLQIPTTLGTPKELMAKYQLLLTTAGLGARPAVFIRDTFQALTGMSVLGLPSFAEGLARAMTPEGQAIAEEAGALIKGRNVSEAMGDVSGDLPASSRVSDFAVKMADKLMAPSRIGHNIGRSITYLGEEARAAREIARFRAGEITDPQELANRTGLWFQDPPPRSRLLAMAADPTVPIPEVAKQFGLAMNDALQFPLRSGTQGAGLRTGMGRIFGQYATWPMNYIELVRKLSARAFDNPIKGVPALGAFAAINYGAFEGMKSLGVDAGKWLFFSPAGYTGSPNLELLQNIAAAPEETPAGLEARRKLHQFPMEMIPAGVEINSILQAIDSGDTSWPRLLGFKPLKDQPEQDFDDWIRKEMGFTNPR